MRSGSAGLLKVDARAKYRPEAEPPGSGGRDPPAFGWAVVGRCGIGGPPASSVGATFGLDVAQVQETLQVPSSPVEATGTTL